MLNWNIRECVEEICGFALAISILLVLTAVIPA
jgi:hypothetical protein